MSNLNANANKPRPTALGVPYETALEIGARLRAARESSGRSHAAVASRVKIREHYLAAIEQGQWGELPPGLNGRGLVRIYAREMGVDVPELEPQQTPTSTHPHYEPISQVSVISRQALMERELTRASQDIARSVPRNNGGSLHTSGRAAGSGYGTRGTARAPLPSPGSLPLGLPAQSAARGLDARAQEIIQRNANATADRVRSDREDEAPLDVITPDVASILGLTEQDIPSREPLFAVGAKVPESSGIPEVSAESMAAEMFGGAGDPPSEPKAPTFEEVPETQPISRLFNEPPETRPAAPMSFDPQDVSGVPRPLDEGETRSPSREDRSIREGQDARDSREGVAAGGAAAGGAAALFASARNEEGELNRGARAETPETQSVAAVTPNLGSGDWPQTGVPSEASKGLASVRTTARGLSGKALMGYTVAALALVALGSVFFPRGGEDSTLENGKVVEGSPEETGAKGATLENPSTDVSMSAGTDSNGTDTNGLPSNVSDGALGVSAAASGVVAGESTGPDVLVTPSEASSSTGADAALKSGPAEAAVSSDAVALPETPVAPVATAVVNAQNAETSIVRTGAVGRATLTLLDAVEVQVTVDGKRIYSGVKPAGTLNIDFTKNAEIFVDDGSKAKLTYGDWDHGALGHSGRKRRIFLNAGNYQPPQP